MTEKGVEALAKWVVKNNPGIPKEAVLVWVTNLNENLILTGKADAAKAMQAQKLLGEALGISKVDPKGRPHTPQKESPTFEVPGL